MPVYRNAINQNSWLWHNTQCNTETEISADARNALNDYVLKHYSDVFDGLGQIPGEYTEPTKWVSSMVVVQKRNGKIHVCLDSRNLNQTIMCSHYPLPTIEEVTTRLTNTKLFTVLDAKSGFWQVKPDEPSNYLTTFNTPFGR